MPSIQSSGEFFKRYLKTLSNLYELEEAKTILFWLLEDYYQLRKSDILSNKELVNPDFEKLDRALKRLENNEPIQHVLGYAWFLGEKYQVNHHVLIPRQETEELVHLIISENQKQVPYILDIGTGSGVIAIALKKQITRAHVMGWDISEEALKVAKLNAKINQAQVIFECKDILANPKAKERYDIIVSNPPYILEKEKPQMSKNVLDFEPPIALFVSNDDPLMFYKQITEFAKSHLNINGCLFFEINEHYGVAVCKLLAQNGFGDVKIVKDLNCKDRIVVGILK